MAGVRNQIHTPQEAEFPMWEAPPPFFQITVPLMQNVI